MSIKKIRTIQDIKKEKAALKMEMKAIEVAAKSSVVKWSVDTPKSVAEVGLSMLGVELVHRMIGNERVQGGVEEEKPFYYSLMHTALDRLIEVIENQV